MSIHQINFTGKDKVEIAIERLQTFEPPEGYWLAFSGGKDSIVIKTLADMAGVKYTAHYSVTSVDPPELVRFIKEHHSDVEFILPRDKDGKRVSMWTLIPTKQMPPTRIARYCCEALKEAHGLGRLTVTGVRWAESVNRKRTQGGISIFGKPKELKESDEVRFNRHGGGMLRLDNSENKKVVDMCYKSHKTLINPIIDWTTEEVWEFIKEYDLAYCDLYDQGWTRLGCIGCPMANHKEQMRHFELYPKYKELYLKAFKKMLENCKSRGAGQGNWKDENDVFKWWLGLDREIDDTIITSLIEETE